MLEISRDIEVFGATDPKCEMKTTNINLTLYYNQRSQKSLHAKFPENPV